MAFITIKNLSFKYKNCDKYAIKNIDIEIEKGDFVVICGESGSGKTTLLRNLKPELSPNGERIGEILFENENLYSLDNRITAKKIGFVSQNPNNQIVTDKVYHELAFGLESLGEKKETIKKKVAEISQFFGISELYDKNTCELSGGQKQILNLASVMIMQPSLLIFDEPTGQLDPITAEEFLHSVKRINEELGITVIIVEHRLETVFSLASKILILDNSSAVFYGEPRNVGKYFSGRTDDKNYNLTPTYVKLFLSLKSGENCPINILEAQKYLSTYTTDNIKSLDISYPRLDGKVVVALKDVYFRYSKNGNDILKGLSLNVYDGEIYSIVGGNGAGKSTLLKAIANILKPYSGKIKINGKNIKDYKNDSLYYKNVALLGQNPTSMFVKDNVKDDLSEIAKIKKIDKNYFENLLDGIVKLLSIEDLLSRHPYDLSGGEMQKVALAKVLLLEPKILLLDEITKGLDNNFKIILGNILRKLQGQGITIIMVTHDIEFSSEYATRVGMMFANEIVTEDYATRFFADNQYYTTSAMKISRGYYENAVTADQLIELALLNKK